MEQEPPGLPETESNRRSLMGGWLSTEYEPCSVAASQLARSATEMISRYSEGKLKAISNAQSTLTDKRFEYRDEATDFRKERLQATEEIVNKRKEALRERLVISELSFPTKQLSFSHNLMGPDNKLFPLSLVQNVTEYEQGYTQKVEVKKRFGKEVKLREWTETERELGDVWLADRVAGGIVLMQVAAFQPREGGSCSFVQLGQEISDDSIFAVQADEKTKRIELIDDLRKLFVNQSERKYTDTVRKFVSAERERNAGRLVIALGEWTTKKLRSELDEKGGPHHNIVVETGGEITYQDDVVMFRVPESEVKLHLLPVCLKVSQPAVDSEDEAPVMLSAVARGNVAFPILELFTDSGEVRFADEGKMSDSERYGAMMAVISLIKPDNRGEFQQSIGGKDITPTEYLLKIFSIRERVETQLSPECAKQEQLALEIGSRALGTCYKGTVRDVTMDTTHGDMSGSIVLERVNDAFSVRVAAKPDTLVGTPMGQDYVMVYDPAQPLAECLPSGEDADHFTNLIRGYVHVKV